MAQPQSAQCAAAYHVALEPVRRDRATGLGDLLRRLRTPEADLPGRWLYAAQVFQKAKPRPQAKAERVCVELKDVRGQQRCLRYEIKPAPPPAPEIVTKAQPPAEDLRFLRLLNDVVEGRVVVPDVSINGKQTFLVQRLSQDLRLYVTQPATPVLCAGAGELLEFYAGQLGPVKRRHEELKAAAKRVGELAAARTRDVAVTEGRLYDVAMVAVKAAEAARSRAVEARAAAEAALAAARAAEPVPTAEPGASAPSPSAPPAPPPNLPPLPPVPPAPAKPAAPASLADYAVTSPSAQISEALRPLLPADLVAEIAAERDTVAMLTRAHKALLDPGLTLSNPPAPEVRDMAIAALRLHEAQVYAERYATRYGEISTLLAATLADVKAAHGKSCTCQD